MGSWAAAWAWVSLGIGLLAGPTSWRTPGGVGGGGGGGGCGAVGRWGGGGVGFGGRSGSSTRAAMRQAWTHTHAAEETFRPGRRIAPTAQRRTQHSMQTRAQRRLTAVQGVAVGRQAALVHIVVHLQLHLATDVHRIDAEPGAGHAREGHVKLRGAGRGGAGQGRAEQRRAEVRCGVERAEAAAAPPPWGCPRPRPRQPARLRPTDSVTAGWIAGLAGWLAGAHMDLQDLSPARVHAQLVKGGHLD